MAAERRAGRAAESVASGQLVALLCGSSLSLAFAAVSTLGRRRARAVLLAVGPPQELSGSVVIFLAALMRR
ncbi:hypothetical protein [Streptomyces mexicanus]|uniref:Uncharacterized protein n=1 Tax=Streptomyces mexicanus TaxID=178566 RepID=A0A7X1I5H2_9ACTN|nr:hypothetical protein [Streptomyces mexicanus]MBC2866938.1 hypothetical protein [Streptomyces mexicanus]